MSERTDGSDWLDYAVTPEEKLQRAKHMAAIVPPLPPLPEPIKELLVSGDHDATLRFPMEDVYDADQMHAYARAAIAALFPPALDAPVDGFKQICDALGVGEHVRSVSVVLANIKNLQHFTNLLHTIEREFFMMPGEPDEDFPDEEPADDCLLNSWGSNPKEYVEQFRAALPRITSPVAAQAVTDGVALIAAERQRQVSVEGWTQDHDTQWAEGQLARAAACYAKPRPAAITSRPQGWPWATGWWKPSPKDRVRELAKAGALIAAEIDRLQRAHPNAAQGAK